MTTENDELGTLIEKKGNSVTKEGVHPTGTDDPRGEFPRASYWYKPSTNQGVTGAVRHELSINGGVPGSDDRDQSISADTSKNNVNESECGHVIEINDTPGGERILIKHRTGAGVEIRADGTIVVATTGNRITVVQGDDNIQVEGNANVQYNGNLNVEVAGDYNLDIAGNYNVYVAGNLKQGIDGSHRSTVRGNRGDTVIGAKSETTKGPRTVTNLAGLTHVVKGERRESTEGDVICSSSGMFKISSEARFIASSPDVNMAAKSISVFGDTGTIGGENVIMYNYNMWTGHSIHVGDTNGEGGTVTADQLNFERADGDVVHSHFVGDVTGKADNANAADFASTAGSAPLGSAGSPGSNEPAPLIDVHEEDITVTALPNAAILNTYLDKGAFGVPEVKIDVDDKLLNALDKTAGTGNVTNKPLTVGEVRSKLRDNGTLNNTDFTSAQIADGKLNPQYPIAIPGEQGRVAGSSPTRTAHDTIIGPQSKLRGDIAQTFTPNKRSGGFFIPDINFNPNFSPSNITADIHLQSGVTLAKFLGGEGEKTNLNHLTEAEKLQVARNFTPQAEAMRLIDTNTGVFKNHKLVVREGLYIKGPQEELTSGSLNDLATTGRVVVYQLLGLDGQADNQMMFDLATYWKDTVFFDELELAYDKFDPSGKLECQVILVMPTIPTNYAVKYKQKIKTTFNGNLQASNSLVEITS